MKTGYYVWGMAAQKKDLLRDGWQKRPKASINVWASREMKAIVQEKYGSPDDLGFREVGKPAVGDDDVLVRVGGKRKALGSGR